MGLFNNCLCHPVQALVDRPDMVRRQMNFKRLVLTDFKIDIPRLAKKKVLTAALEESGAPPCCLQHWGFAGDFHAGAEEFRQHLHPAVQSVARLPRW